MTTQQEIALIIEGREAATSGRGARLREAAGLTRVEVARLAGVTPAAVSRWEAGKRTPRGRSAIAYAQALRAIGREVALRV